MQTRGISFFIRCHVKHYSFEYQMDCVMQAGRKIAGLYAWATQPPVPCVGAWWAYSGWER